MSCGPREKSKIIGSKAIKTVADEVIILWEKAPIPTASCQNIAWAIGKLVQEQAKLIIFVSLLADQLTRYIVHMDFHCYCCLSFCPGTKILTVVNELLSKFSGKCRNGEKIGNRL
jgi:hypothetical protein